MTKKLEKALASILNKYEAFTDYIMGMAFTRDPFIDEFRKMFGLKDDAAYVEAFKSFMETTHETFRWNDYLDARTTAEETFRKFYAKQQYPEADLENALHGFILSFFMANVDQSQVEWDCSHPNEAYANPNDTEDDIDNMYLARVFACAGDITDAEENKAFCETIGVSYDHEQLHMCVWFSGQITNGAGHYSRTEPNYSGRTTYNRLLEPRSLLWIGVVMGADRDALKAAAEELKDKKSNQTKCGIVRKHVPFDTIRALYQKMIYEEGAEE